MEFFALFRLSFQSALTNIMKSALAPDDHIGYRHSHSTFLSRITFFWLTPFLWRGYHDPIELDDLGTLHEADTCRTHYDRFHFIYRSFQVCWFSAGHSILVAVLIKLIEANANAAIHFSRYFQLCWTANKDLSVSLCLSAENSHRKKLIQTQSEWSDEFPC